MADIKNTIFALATPPGRSGVAVVRVSGPAAHAGLEALADDAFSAAPAAATKTAAGGGGHAPLPSPNIALCGLYTLKDGVSRETIDRALVLIFSAPRSFTGEDVVEYHVHGGPAVIQALLDVLAGLPGHRMAGPGEFTRRAFENGKMDLTEAEALADLINAETSAQKNQALAQMDGVLSRLYNRWTEALKEMLAHLEADIEFPDEDLPEGIAPRNVPEIESLRSEMKTHLADNRRGERLRAGLQVAVIGAPNAGKSSLVNALAQRDVAIVSETAGTTRDIIEAHLDLGGYPFIVADTAGLRPDQIGAEGQEGIESEGIRRALKKAEEADIRLLLFDATVPEPDPGTLALYEEGPALLVVNKCDQARTLKGLSDAIEISAETGEGLESLIGVLIQKAGEFMGLSEAPAITRRRHRIAVQEAADCLGRALSADLPELMAEDLRLAMRALGRITGRVDVEDLLDVIFRDFCIGK